MSRVGRAPIMFDAKVKVTISPSNEVTVKGEKKTEKVQLPQFIQVAVDGNKVILTRKEETREARSSHGLARALLQNAVDGVTRGFTKELELVGVGYRANLAGKSLDLSLGFSHPIQFPIPDGIEIKVEKQTRIMISGSNRGLVGQVAAKIRNFRPPEPYLGKGVKYSDEKIRRKAGKSATK